MLTTRQLPIHCNSYNFFPLIYCYVKFCAQTSGQLIKTMLHSNKKFVSINSVQ